MSDKLDDQQERELKKVYELIALHELPYIKWIYKFAKQTTILVWILFPLTVLSLVISAVTILVLTDFF